MLRTELKETRKEFNKRYIRRQLWPLRVPKTVHNDPPVYRTERWAKYMENEDHCIPFYRRLTPLDEQIEQRKKEKDAHALMKQPIALKVAEGIEESVTFTMNVACGKRSFGFLFDRVGDAFIVFDISDPEIEITLGSMALLLNDVPIHATVETEMMAQKEETEEQTVEQRQENTRKQMINVFEKCNIHPRSTKPCTLFLRQPPQHSGTVRKFAGRSKFKPWSVVTLSLQNGYLAFFSSPERLNKCTIVHRMQSGLSCRHLTARILDSNDPEHTTRKDFCFLVQCQAKTWIFKAETESDQLLWIQTLHYAHQFSSGKLLDTTRPQEPSD